MKKHISEILLGNGDKISINSLKDLRRLPDKSVVVLFNNSNYIEVVYLYVLYKLDMHLENVSYTEKTREKYFNICFSIIPRLIQYQDHFLAGGQLHSDGVFDVIPTEIKETHQNCVENISSFISGILSTTPHLDSELFPREKLMFVKHNYASMLNILSTL